MIFRYLIAFLFLAFVILVGVLVYRERRNKQSAYKNGYELGTQLLFTFDVEEIKIFADATNEGRVLDAYNRGLYQALEDNK